MCARKVTITETRNVAAKGRGV